MLSTVFFIKTNKNQLFKTINQAVQRRNEDVFRCIEV